MNKQFKMIGAALVIAGNVHAEFGVGAGTAFGLDASFHSDTAVLSRNTEPGADRNQTDHLYDDGYNRVDSSGNFGGLTTYWDYDNDAQYNPAGLGTITMNSAQTTIHAGSQGGTMDQRQPALEFYWQVQFAEDKEWDWGVRTALHWQKMKVDAESLRSTTIETLSDAYSLDGRIPPGADGDSGSFPGPNVVLSDNPDRSFSSVDGPSVMAHRKLNTDLLSIRLGPTLSYDLDKDVRVVFSAGAEVAWVGGDFSYADGSLAAGSMSISEWTYGGYIGLDLQNQISERWGVFAGLSYAYLAEVDIDTDGRFANLEFSRLLLSVGLFFQ